MPPPEQDHPPVRDSRQRRMLRMIDDRADDASTMRWSQLLVRGRTTQGHMRVFARPFVDGRRASMSQHQRLRGYLTYHQVSGCHPERREGSPARRIAGDSWDKTRR